MTDEPAWLHSVIWELMIGSWSIRPSIWAGPKIVVSDGNRYARTWP